MANKKYTELPQADAITGAEILAMVQDGGSVQGNIDLIKAYFDTLYAPIGGKTYITQQATNTRVTGSGPSSLGNYRSYLRAAGTRTYSETNGAPTTGPSASNGYILYVPADYATGDANNQPSRYEIFIGTNKEPIFEFYSGTGRTGVVFVNPFQNFGGLDVNGGVCTSYDPASGIARILAVPFNGGVFYAGIDASGGTITADIYFDIKC